MELEEKRMNDEQQRLIQVQNEIAQAAIKRIEKATKNCKSKPGVC